MKRYGLICLFFLFVMSLICEYFEFFALIEEQTISFRQILRHKLGDRNQLNFPADKIVFVNIDELFFKQYKGFPLRRTDIGKIISNLNSLGAKVIGVDMVMDFVSSYGEDPFFAEILKQSDNVVLASQAVFDADGFRELRYPAPSFRKICSSGYTNVTSTMSVVTSLSRLHIYPEIANIKDGWPIAIQILSKYFGVFPKLQNGILTIGDISVTLNQFNELLIDFPIIPGDQKFLSRFSGLSALEFLDISGLDENDLAELKYWIDGKIVLFGDTSEISHDCFDTPIGSMYGVEIIGSTINTLLNNGSLKPASMPIEILSLFLFLSFIIIASYRLSDPRIRTVVIAVIFCTFIAIISSLYVYLGLVISLTYSLILGSVVYFTISLESYIRERNAKKAFEERSQFIRDIFGRYLSDEIVKTILDSPEGLKLGGEKKLVTIMMTDLRGFTTIGERLPPEDVVTMINDFLKEMTPIIVKYQGTIDEFIGDAILAIFGAPITRENDAGRAVACAIEMQLAMENVNQRNTQRGFPKIEMGIGLNTGEVVVGNIGSEIRSKYGVVGKNVNLTSRIESYTVGGQIYISKQTKDAVGQILKIESHMDVTPKGVKQAITIYEVRGIGGDFNLYLPEKIEKIFIKPNPSISCRISVLSGKHTGDETFHGSILRLNEKMAEIKADIAIELLNNLKITVFDNNNIEITKDLYAKVTELIDDQIFMSNFTAVPPEAEQFFKAVIKGSADISVDENTGVFVQNHILECLSKEAIESVQYSIDLSVVLFDIDNLSHINSTHSYDIGNKILAKVAETIKSKLKETDRIGRYDDVKFLVMLTNTNKDNCIQFAENIRQSVESLKWDVESLHVTISAGCARLRREEDITKLLKRVSNHLNRAKENGSNRIES